MSKGYNKPLDREIDRERGVGKSDGFFERTWKQTLPIQMQGLIIQITTSLNAS